MLSGMAALNGGLGATGLTNGTAGTMDALTQAYSGIQQYAAAALPTLYSQSLLQQQSAAGSQKEGRCARPGPEEPVEQQRHRKPLLPLPLVGFFFSFKKRDKATPYVSIFFWVLLFLLSFSSTS